MLLLFQKYLTILTNKEKTVMKIKDLLTALYILIKLSFLITITSVQCNQWKYSYTPCDNLSKNYKDYVIRATKDSDIEEFMKK